MARIFWLLAVTFFVGHNSASACDAHASGAGDKKAPETEKVAPVKAESK